MDSYMTAQRDQIFKNVQVLIYVFDVESREVDKVVLYLCFMLTEMRTYRKCLGLPKLPVVFGGANPELNSGFSLPYFPISVNGNIFSRQKSSALFTRWT
jgi:hypothetical protein